MKSLLLLLLASVPSLSQGLYWESMIVGEGDTAISHTYYMPKMLKEVGRGDGKAIVIRLDKQLFIMIDDTAREYTEMTFAQIETVMTAMTGQLSAQMKELEEQLAALPPDQRKAVEEMMGSKMPGKKPAAKIEVEKAGETVSIGGYDCRKNVLKREGKAFLTIWTTTGIQGVESFNAEMKEIGKRMSSLNPMGDMAEIEAMISVDGFAMKTEYSGSTTLVTSVAPKNIPASEFEPPAGYRKVEPEMPGRVDTTQHK